MRIKAANSFQVVLKYPKYFLACLKASNAALNFFGLSVLPESVETGVNRLLRGSSIPITDPPKRSLLRKWRSVDSLRPEESPTITRSPSPAPSSGIETSSIKDSPMPLEFMAADTTSAGKVACLY